MLLLVMCASIRMVMYIKRCSWIIDPNFPFHQNEDWWVTHDTYLLFDFGTTETDAVSFVRSRNRTQYSTQVQRRVKVNNETRFLLRVVEQC